MHKVIEEDLKDIISYNLPWYELTGKNILITGAYGIIPTYLVLTLIKLNETILKDNPCSIYALGRNIAKAKAKFGESLSKINFLTQDVCKKIKLDIKFDYIVHAASFASPKYYGASPVDVMTPNIIGTKNLLDLCKTNPQCRFLFISTSEVYSISKQPSEFLHEEILGAGDPLVLRNCYSESKRAGETLCASYKHQYGVDTIVVRPFHSYGPGMPLDDGRVFADFVKNIVNNEDIILSSNGSAIRAFCYLSDVTTGLFTTLLKGKSGLAYNLGNPMAAVAIRELANELVSIFPDKKLNLKFKNLADSNYIPSRITDCLPDITRLEALNWTPRIGIKEGFKRTILSYAQERGNK